MSSHNSIPNHVCRSCLKSTPRVFYIDSVQTFPLAKLFNLIVPALHLNVSVKPVICMPCYKSLCQAYSFRLRCMQSEKLICIYMKEKGIPFGNVKLHDVVEYCKGVFKPKFVNPNHSQTSVSNDANDAEPERETFPEQYEKESTGEGQLLTREARSESDGSEADFSGLNTTKNKIFVRPRFSYVNKQLKNKPGTSENNNITLSTEPEIETNTGHSASSVEITEACQRYLTGTCDVRFRAKNDILNQAVNQTVPNIVKDTGKKIERPKLHPAPARKLVFIKKPNEHPLHQIDKGTVGNIMKQTKKITLPVYFPEVSRPKVPVNTYSGPSAPRPNTQASTLPQPPTPPSPPSLPAPHVPVNIKYIPQNKETDEEMLTVLQNSNLFREHVRNSITGHEHFILRRIVNKNNRLLGYSVDIGNDAESESDGSRQKFVVWIKNPNNPSEPLTEVDSENLHEIGNNEESLGLKSVTTSTEISTTEIENISSAPATLSDTENNQKASGLKPVTSSSEISTAAMPRIRVRPESSLKKVRTLNHELFPQAHLPSKNVHFNFRDTYSRSAYQDPSFSKSPSVMEVTKIHSNQYSDGTKQTPFVLNPVVARQKVTSPLLEISNAPIIPGLVPVTKEHLKQMGIERICIKRLPPSYTRTRISPVVEKISIREEPPEDFIDEEYITAIKKENEFVQNDLEHASSTPRNILPVDDFNEVEPLRAIKSEPTFVQNDLEDVIDIKEEPLSYDDDVSMQGFESNDQDAVLAKEPTTNSSEIPLNDNLLEHIDTNSNPSTASTLSASSLDDDTLHSLLDIAEIEDYDTPEYIHIKKVDPLEHVESGKEDKQQQNILKCSDSEKPKPTPSDKIPDFPVCRQRKRFRLVKVDNEDEPTKKKRIIIKAKPAIKRTTPLDENICTLFTKFTNQGDYINDHDYLVSPYERYGMTELSTNQQRCWCLLCDHALPIEEHINHMQFHGTCCQICRLNFNNVFLLNFHVRQHIYRCPDCNVNVTYNRYVHHAETHNASRHLENIDLVCDRTKSPTTTSISRRSCTVTRKIQDDGKQPVSALDVGETVAATNEKQLQSEETPNDTNINTISTESPSLNLVTRKRRRSQPKRKSRRRKIGKKIDKSQKIKVEDKSGMCEVSEPVMPENTADKSVESEAPESNDVATAKVTNVLQMKETNLEENNSKQASDTHTDDISPCTSVNGLENEEKDVTNSTTSRRRRKYLRSSNTPLSLRINRHRQKSSKTKRYPIRKSVAKIDANIPLSSITPVNTESDASSHVASSSDINCQETVNNYPTSRSEILEPEPAAMSNNSNDQPEETPLAVLSLDKDHREHIASSQKNLLDNSQLQTPEKESNNTEDNMVISEEKSATIDEIESTEATTHSGNGMRIPKIITRRKKLSPEDIENALKEVLVDGASFRSVANKYSISVVTLHRYHRKMKEGNKEQKQTNNEEIQTNLDYAAKEVLDYGESIGIAAKKYSIHYKTLHRYCQKLKKGNEKEKQIQTKHTKRKSRRPVLLEDGSYDVDDALCLVCSKEYSKSKPGEEWIRCTKCLGWAHEKCVNADTYFVCQKCDLDHKNEIPKDVIEPTVL